MAFSALSPVSVGVFALLQDSALLAALPGGVHEDVPQLSAFPYVAFEVSEDDTSNFGARPGSGVGSASRVNLRCHVFSQYGGMTECQTVMAKLKELLSTKPTVTPYTCHEIFFERVVPVGDEEIGGIKVKELVGDWWMAIEEPAA